MMMIEHNPWTINKERNVYDNPWINLTEYDVINPGGGKSIYGKVHFKNTAVGVLVLDKEMNTYLVGQYRFVLNAYSWEIPEGGSPQEEAPLEGAKRELREETGLEAADWQVLLQMHLSNSISDELAIIYLARDIIQYASQPEETEELVVKKIPFTEAYAMVSDGIITDSISVAAIIKIKLLLAEGKLK